MRNKVQKPDPVVGMTVSWIFPSMDMDNAEYVHGLVQTYGRVGLRIDGVFSTMDGPEVALTKDGEPIAEVADSKVTEKTKKRFGWCYLMPIQLPI